MEEIQFKRKLFGGEILIIVYNVDKNIAEDILQETYDEALRLQKIFNFYDEKSELCKLNKKRKMEVSEDLRKVIQNALEISKLTNGKYDITIGKQILQRKNNQDISKFNCSYKDIRILDNEITLNHPDVLIDLGSIAKGYITDKIADFLIDKGIEEFLIDSRGDILVSGENIKKIGIQDPRKKDELINYIEIKDRAIATSGDYSQYSESFDKSHIINQNDSISVTVIAKTLEEADVYATALFVLGKSEIERILKEKNIQALIMDRKLNLKYYNGFENLILKKESKNE